MPDDKKDPSVLGNLPRSRPGRRSDKRDGGKKAAASSSSASKPASARSRAKAKRPPSKPRASARPAGGSSRAAASRRQPTDPVTGAIRLAGQVAGAGLKVAGEVLKRLPRP